MVEEIIDDYVLAYLKHKVFLKEASQRECEFHKNIMKNIVAGAVLKFGIKSSEFDKLCSIKQGVRPREN